MKKLLINESEKHRIKKMYGLLNESQTKSIDKNVSSPDIKKILIEIQNELNDFFTDKHFEDERTWSGNEVRYLPGQLLPEVEFSFENLKQRCPSISMKSNGGYRDLRGQKKQFIEYARQNGGTITGGQQQAAIPGFSQHNSGRAIDITNYNSCTEEDYNEFGFIRPFFPDPPGPRIAEPWHLYYVDFVTKKDSLKDLRIEISEKTKNESVDLNSIRINLDNKTFSIDGGTTKISEMLLRYNTPNEPSCPSCEETKRQYGSNVIKSIDGKFQNNTRMFSLIIVK